MGTVGWGSLTNRRALHWDWAPLEGCFPTKNGNTIQPSDLDFVVERRGYFLVFETKRHGERLKMGQQIMLENLASKPGCTVFVITGNLNDPSTVQRVTPNGILPATEATWESLRILTHKWFQWVESHEWRGR